MGCPLHLLSRTSVSQVLCLKWQALDFLLEPDASSCCGVGLSSGWGAGTEAPAAVSLSCWWTGGALAQVSGSWSFPALLLLLYKEGTERWSD